MQIIIQQAGGSFEQVRDEFNRITNLLKNPDPTEAVKRVADAWSVSYKREGSEVGGWRGLAERTLEDRARQGFSAGPILIREGKLYATSVAFFQQGRPGSTRSASSYGSSAVTTANLSISDGIATLSVGGPKTILQYGDRSKNLPPRPFWFSNTVAQRGARDGVIEWIVKKVVG